MIMGGKLYSGKPERSWMYEIVSNSRNGIDVDKFDYLSRDTHKMNVGYCSFNPDIIMKGARVVENQICFPEKREFEVKKLFDSRYNLYNDVYYHKTTQGHECILLDILNETNGVLYDYLEAIRDPKLYIDLDDTILHEVRISQEPELEKARGLVSRLDHRQFYSCVAQKKLSQSVADTMQTITE